MSHYPSAHLCKCDPDEKWASRTYYHTLTKTETSGVLLVETEKEMKEALEALENNEISLEHEPTIVEYHLPVLVCDGCDREVLLDKDDWYANWVREGEHFYYMHLADKDGTLEYKGTTIGNTMERGINESL